MKKQYKYLKKIILLTIPVIILLNCKSINIKPTRPDYLVFQDFVEKAKTADYYRSEGFIKIKGLSEASAIKLPVPLKIVTLRYQLVTSLKQGKSILIFSLLNKKIEIFIEDNNYTIIDHMNGLYYQTESSLIEQNIIEKFLGIELNPLKLGYVLLGTIPYDKSLQLMSDPRKSDDTYKFEITTQSEKYDLTTTYNGKMQSLILSSGEYATIKMHSFKYKLFSDNINLPNSFSVESENSPVSVAISVTQAEIPKKIEFSDAIIPDNFKPYELE